MLLSTVPFVRKKAIQTEIQRYNFDFSDEPTLETWDFSTEEIVEVLGDTNRDIVNTIILDIIEHSMDKPYIKMSDDVYHALFALKKFNYENIYQYSVTSEELEYFIHSNLIIFQFF